VLIAWFFDSHDSIEKRFKLKKRRLVQTEDLERLGFQLVRLTNGIPTSQKSVHLFKHHILELTGRSCEIAMEHRFCESAQYGSTS